MIASGELVPLAQGVLAWRSSGQGLGHANAGVVIDTDGITLVDTLTVASQWEPFADAVDALGPPIRRVVLTSSHISFVGGTGRFWQAGFYGRSHTSDMLELPPNPDGYRRLMPDLATELDDDLATRPVTHVVEQAAALTDAVVVRPTQGQAPANLVVEVPGAGITFAGAMGCFATTPLAFDGDPARWAAELRELADRASVVVPGHGPIGGSLDLEVQASYLEACCAGSVPPGPWDDWPDRRFDVVNIERAAMLANGDDGPPPALLNLLGL